MREGWRRIRIGDELEVVTGNTPPKSNDLLFGDFMPLVKPPELRDCEISSAEDGLSQAGAQFARIAPIGSVLVSCIGNLGKTGLNSVPVGFNQQINAILPSPDRVVPEFLFYQVLSMSFRSRLEALASGTTIAIVNKSRFQNIEIALPPLPEQQRIVALLDEAFAGLATAKENAERNLQNARSLFESHLESVFTRQGPGWITTSIGELVDDGVLAKPFDGNHGEIHPKKSDYTESGVPFVMARDLKDGLVDTRQCTYISRKQAESLRVGFAKDGDVLISHKGTIGRTAILRTAEDFIMLTPQVTAYRVTDNKRLDNRFARYYFMSPGFQREMAIGAADGSTRAYIGITKQLSLPFSFPALTDQQRIADRLCYLYKETQHLTSIYERKLAALDELKTSLLHQAFNGEL